MKKQYETSYELQAEAIDYYYEKVNELVKAQKRLNKLLDKAYEINDSEVVEDIRNKYHKVTKALQTLLEL